MAKTKLSTLPQDILNRLIIESASDYAIFTLDSRHRVTSWNNGAKKVLGYSSKEIIGRSGRLLFTSADRRAKVPQHETSTALKEGRAEDQRWHLRKDKSVFWASGIMMPMRDQKGKLLGFLKILRDMTPQKLAESAQEHFKALVENIQDYAIMMLDRHGNITEWNEGAARLKGYTADQVVGRHLRIFYTKEAQRNKCPEQELYVASHKGRSEVEGWRVRRDGSRFWVNEIITPIKEKGEVVAFAKISRDLTERREAEDALRMMNDSLERRVQERTAEMQDYQTRLRAMALQLNKTQEEERQRIAADLHDNLAQILALSEMRLSSLQNKIEDPGAAKSAADIEKYIDQAIKYTRSLMVALSPPVLQKRELIPAVQWLAAEMETHGLKTTVRDDGKPKPVEKEAFNILFQGVRELLFNVIKHAKTEKAFITLKRKGPCVYVTVADRGRGFDVHGRKKVEGFGLFALSERLQLLGGKLVIQSKRGQGTCAIMSASLEETVPSTREVLVDGGVASRQKDGDGAIRVLIVDDHKLMRDGLRKILEEEPDIQIVGEAVDGRKAIAAIGKSKPDVVLLDINMPNMDGIETARRITARKNAPAVIGLSIHEDRAIAQSIKKAGACDYLSKRETANKLYSTVRHWARKNGKK